MHLKFLDEDETKKLLEGAEDVITPAAEADSKFYASQNCPRCGGTCKKIGDFHRMFQQDGILPKFDMECIACGEQFDPRTGITIRIGNISKAIEPRIPILKKD